MNRIILGLVMAFLLSAIPFASHSQQRQPVACQEVVDYDITDIAIFDERIIFMYDLLNDCRFDVTINKENGMLSIRSGETAEGLSLEESFLKFRKECAFRFSNMDKDDATALAKKSKAALPEEVVNTLMMDVYIKSRQNNLCANAEPFCTDNGLYQFPAGVNAGQGESGPYYDCLHSTPNPAWYYMKIGTPGNITIHMYSTPSEDIDFCCWGPFSDPTEPCPTGLTQSKVVSCSYSMNASENCQIPSSATTGQYYIMVITNYSNHSCNISFSKTSGSGTTDCSIMPPLVDNDGPFCVGDNIHLTGNAQSGASYNWTGPNGFTSNQQNPTINNCTMAMSGTYTCTITVGSQSSNASTQVQVNARPTANFTATAVCLGTSTQFTSTSTTNPAGQNMVYNWNFGDGQSSRLQNPTHQFATAGNHSVTLTVSCGNGPCPSSKTQDVVVYAMPTANAGADQTIAYGAHATLQGSGGIGNFNYHWEPADKVANPNAQQTQTIDLVETTTFTLEVTNPQGGCSSSDQVTVLVQGAAMTASASATPSSICLGNSTQLQATAVGGTGNYTYSWTPTTNIGNPSSPNPIAYPTETTTYTCVVSDGQTTKTLQTTVTVNYPEEEEEEAFICPGEEYDFYGTPYTEEGDYEYHTFTSQGCDKTITLHLHKYPSYDETVITEQICPGESYYFYGVPYNNTGNVSVTDHTVHGCDSIVSLHLTVFLPNDTILDKPSICVNQTYNFHGTEYSHDGDVAYFDTIDNHGCLLVEKMILTVGDYQTPTPPVETQYICYAPGESPSFYWDKTEHTYHHDTIDQIILPDPNGDCDFKYQLDLKFHQEYYNENAVTECDEYIWPVTGERFTATNHHILKQFDHQINQNFVCDSTFVLDLTINHSSESTLNVDDECDQYVWNFGWDGESYTYDESGTYTRTIDTKLGCDSTVTLNLHLDYTPDFPRVEGKSWVVGGSEFQYNIEKYWVDTDPKAIHTTRWHFSKPEFNQWQLVPFGLNQDSCLVYIFTFEQDSIELCATTQGPCGTFTHSRWIHCGHYAVPEHRPNVNVEIFPNPNDGQMTLAFENMVGTVSITILDLTGIPVDKFQIPVGNERQAFPYNATRLSPGVYFFSITSKEGTIVKKVTVVK